MRPRYASTSSFSHSFGPGPLTPVIRILVYTNIAAFVLTTFAPAPTLWFGLRPADVFGGLMIWQPVTYMFLHGGLFHILFNMLALWMFGTELERMWGSRYFARYYFAAGVGAAVTTLLLAWLPGPFGAGLYQSLTIGASGAVYGVLLAYALYFPNRPIYMYFFFPIPAKYFVMIIGGIALLSSVGQSGGGVAHSTHLGGLIAGYLFLKRGRFHPILELRYWLVRWRIDRSRRRFDVYDGGRRDRIH
ncbi:MAG: rhomboid family intramembrane serine protease [Acidimicrobiia bacterium]|nr:rhomboid family intramembrane serine protease [Acidimicrobiia bacterium]